MAKKLMTFKTKGMNRDLSVSAFNPEFAFENINLRLSTNENNTLLSWVNEKGTLPIAILDNAEIKGIPIGTAVIEHKLILFTTDWIYEGNQTTGKNDYIYKLQYEDTSKTVMVLTELYNGNLNFSTYYPLETLVSYEAERILKVYWVDGRNQPRMINIEGTIKPDVDTLFDFVPVIDTLNLQVSITNKVDSGGTFAPGVILYAFTYLNKHGLESNIAYVSPLYYLAHEDRGESPEGKVSNTFIIDILNADPNFEYVRLYAIQRTSINATPFVRRLEDLIITGGTLTYTDNGTTGYTLDPTELLYVGGKEISALTMIDKDNTLFLGNLEEKNNDIRVIQDFFDSWKGTYSPIFIGEKDLLLPVEGFYGYDNQLDLCSEDITAFKGGEYYRFGFQLQKATGEWSEPIFIDDVKNDKYPTTGLNGNVKLYYAISNNIVNALSMFGDILIPGFSNIYKNIRPLIVYPNIADREVLCLGVLNPTVFNIEDRVTNSPFALASWYFRPYSVHSPVAVEDTSITETTEGDSEETETESQETNNTGSAPTTIIDSITRTSYTGEQIPINDIFEGITLSLVQYVDVLLVGVRGSSTGLFTKGRITVEKTNVVTNETTRESIPFKGIVLGKQASNDDPPTYICALVSEPGKLWPRRIYGENELVAEVISRIKSLLYIQINHDASTNEIVGTLASIFNAVNLSIPVEQISGDTGLQNIAANILLDYESGGELSGETMSSVRSKVRSFNLSFLYSYKDVAWIRFSEYPDTGFPIYKGMKVTVGNELYFSGYTPEDEDEITLCVFKFAINPSEGEDYETLVFSNRYTDHINEVSSTALYTVTFNAVSSAALGQEGSALRSGHYDSLYSLQEAESDPTGVSFTNVEIQYAFNEYDNVYLEKKELLTSNTLFFIDLSIVTLNSPDIDFDIEVLGYGTEGLGLRIVGAIPITSNASYHRITTSSAMLESWHNYHRDDMYSRFGLGEKSINVFHVATDEYVGNRFISDYIWNDVEVVNNPAEEDKIHTNDIHDYLVYPWLKTGSLNNDPRTSDVASSLLRTKKESNILVSANSLYLSSLGDLGEVDCKLHFTENQFVHNIRLNYISLKFSNAINYYPNIDKILYNKEGYDTIVRDGRLIGEGSSTENKPIRTGPILMKYKSTSHAVISLASEGLMNILPSSGNLGAYSIPIIDTQESDTETETPAEIGNLTFWGDAVSFNQIDLPLPEEVGNFNFLWLGELYRADPTNNVVRFGGTSKEAIAANNWQIAGKTVSLNNTSATLEWTIGDTYYLRYDCLKTYPFTPEDPNQIIEILSFMCESHVNIDGRYDRNRGQIDNTNMSPLNFNLANPVYSLLNNFFTYKKTKDDDLLSRKYPNQVTYSRTKISGADVDLWTNMTLASVLELDGDKGLLTSLRRFNNQIIAILDTGISLILYNENALITTDEGLPVELGNSNKVTGKKYLSNTIGCSNKWSITLTPNGIYFMDSNDKSIYLFGGEFKNITGELGFSTWGKLNIPSGEHIWTPNRFENFVSYYDRTHLEVLFINDSKALAWSEKLGTFTSFYDYLFTPYFVNLDDTGIWIRNPYSERASNGFIEYPAGIWKHNAGEYCDFFGDIKEYSMTLVGNPEPLLDKIFTNIEFRACVDGEGYTLEDGKYIPLLPFDTLETWNEYQYGTANLGIRNSHAAFKHHHSANGEDTLKRKFRIWRCDIPRDNYGKYEGFKVDNEDFNPQFFGGQSKGHPLDRMRNPWIYMKLTGNKLNVQASIINKQNKASAAVFLFIPNTGDYKMHVGDTSFLDTYLNDLHYLEAKAYVNTAEEGEDPIYKELDGLFRVTVTPYSSAGQYESIGSFNAPSILNSLIVDDMKAIKKENRNIDIGLQASSQQLDNLDPTKVKIEVLAYDKYSPDGTDSKTYDLLENSRVEVHDVVMTYYG